MQFIANAGYMSNWSSPHRVNPYTKAVFDVPPPALHPLTALHPGFSEWKAALYTARPILEAFREYPGDFQAEFMEINPILSDLQITHLPSKTSIFVELKTTHCQVVKDGAGRDVIEHYQKALGYLDKLLFTFKAQWDYLITTVGPLGIGQSPKTAPGNLSKALCLPRDEIPAHWWKNAEVSQSQGIPLLTWTSDQEDWLQKYTLNFGNPRELVQDLRRIFGSDPTRMKAHREIHMESSSAKILVDDHGPNEEDEADEEGDGEWEDENDVQDIDDVTIDNHFRIGFGSPSHPQITHSEVYEFWAYEVFMELCRRRSVRANTLS